MTRGLLGWRLRGLRGYRLLSKIAEGGMSTIYKALSRKNGEIVAVKILHPKHADRRNKLENLFQEEQVEGTIAGSLVHPNIIRTHAYGTSGEKYYFVMEYINGPNLFNAIYREPELVRGRKIDISLQIAEALVYIHSQGIIHRDVCPKNILLTTDGVVKLIDFGLAILKTGRYRALGERAGTPSYMAPEQVRAVESDERTDIYSFGVTMYELFSESPPFPGRDSYSRMQDHLSTPSVALGQRVPDIPGRLEHIVSRAMQKEPSERYSSAKQMLVELARVKKEEEKKL